MYQVDGKTVLITGAASGLGRGIARVFAGAGAKVALCDVEAGRLTDAAGEIGALGPQSIAVACDVSDRAAVAAAVAQAEAALGPIDILVNNAGVELTGRSIDALSFADLEWIVSVNLWGVLNGVKAVVPGMRARKRGYVVNVASIGGLQVNEAVKLGAYAMTKYAVVAISESLRVDLAADGISVSALCPGAINTEIWNSGRNRPDRFGGATPGNADHPFYQVLKDEGLHPDDVGRILLRSMADSPAFILTDPRMRDLVEARHGRIMAGFDLADKVTAELGLPPHAE